MMMMMKMLRIVWETIRSCVSNLQATFGFQAKTLNTYDSQILPSNPRSWLRLSFSGHDSPPVDTSIDFLLDASNFEFADCELKKTGDA